MLCVVRDQFNDYLNLNAEVNIWANSIAVSAERITFLRPVTVPRSARPHFCKRDILKNPP